MSIGNYGRFLLGISLVLANLSAQALPTQGSEPPNFTAKDINGTEVNLYRLLDTQPDFAILHFFTSSTGEEIALRLQALDQLYGKKRLGIIAVGVKEDETALKKFAADLRVNYYILPDQPEVSSAYGPIQRLPLTFIISKNPAGKWMVERLLVGGGEREANIISEVADAYFVQKKLDDAHALADAALKAGEDPKAVGAVKGYAFVEQGKLDEAQNEFNQIQSKEGLASVALEKGELDKAVELASQAGPDSGYANTIKGTALMRSGKLDEAAQEFGAAATKDARGWQKSEAVAGKGRIEQEKGQVDTAIATYEQAIALDPYNVVALSNEGAAHRQKGDLQKAADVLDQAQKVSGDDTLVAIMLKQVQEEMKKANDTKRSELIRQQIADLHKRYEEQKAAGKPTDDWTSRPLVVAFLPSENATPAFFERAGTDVALRHEIEGRLQEDGNVQVVEREVLDKLLQELNLGSSELADSNTQLRLGKVLSAQLLGFIDFAKTGADAELYLRMVDTETTSIANQLRRPLKADSDLDALVTDVVNDLLGKMVTKRVLQGLIADAASDSAVLINLGKAHGAKVGQQFAVLQDGEPIIVGGREIGRKQTKVATLEVTEVEDQLATCKVTQKNDGAKLAKEMKIKVIGAK
ncbi:MAG: tetratricopeptide repeat protein [Candidatus Hydrogenedentes bacterium]|nr:tetratricopeptide repeat protein [Candidatus Hydrogenedentota bacterium]